MAIQTYKVEIQKNENETILRELTGDDILKVVNAKNKHLSEMVVSLIKNNDNTKPLIKNINQLIVPKLRHYLVDSFLSYVDMYLMDRGESMLTTEEADELAKIFASEGYPQSEAALRDMIERAKQNAQDKNQDKDLTVGPKQEGKPVLGGPRLTGKPKLNR
jgi:hypothetical protein